MLQRQRADAIDTRIVYWADAGLACTGGLLLTVWGPAGPVRLLGAMAMAGACLAVAMANVNDPVSRRRGLLWFGIGHYIVGIAVGFQPFPDWAARLVTGVSVLFIYLWSTADGEGGRDFGTLITLFGDARSSNRRLRSQYEQQIRQAAGQEERHRMARDLHDSIKQQIFVIQTAAATMQARFDEDRAGALQAVEEVRSSAREAMGEMEAMLDQLRAAPLENTGLVEALRKQCEALGFRTGARVEFKPGTLPPSEALEPGAQQAIFRVAQEALANIGRHARAQNVSVGLGIAGTRVEIAIQDDGAGFDTWLAFEGMGIANMRARATEFGGEFWLNSRPGGGTTVRFAVPYEVERPTDYRLRALGWVGVMILFALLAAGFTSWRKAPFVIPGIVIACIGAMRETVAWWRTRK